MSETTTIEKGSILHTGKAHWSFPEIGESTSATLEHEYGSIAGSWYVHCNNHFVGIWMSSDGRFLLSGIGKSGSWERKDVGVVFQSLEQAVKYAYLKWEECGRNPYRKV
jgi:hypothetical protein